MSSKNAEILKKNLAFVYGSTKETAKHDPDKRIFVKSVKKDIIADKDKIQQFSGEYDFLHPSFKCSVVSFKDSKLGISHKDDDNNDTTSTINFQIYPSFDHALYASKLLDLNKKKELAAIDSILEVKRFVSKEQKNFPGGINENWKNDCLVIAEYLLRDKFIRNKDLKEKLINTGDKPLEFYNDYNDLFWGLDKEKKGGQNKLGSLLEKIRKDIKLNNDINSWINCSFSCIKPEKIKIGMTVSKSGVVITEDNRDFTSRNKLFIGKSTSCDVTANHPSISRIHAVVIIDKDFGSFLIDFDSANGTKVNDNNINPYDCIKLKKSSLVQFGASSRCYQFDIDTDYDIKKKELIVNKITDPTISNNKSLTEKNELTVFVKNIPYECTDKEIKEYHYYYYY